MQKLNQKSLLILTVILLVLCLFFIYQWNKKSEQQSNHLNSISGHMIFRNFSSLISEFDYIADTLNHYNNDFTKQEIDLLLHSLNRSTIRLNEISHNLFFLIHTTDRFDERIIDGYLLMEIEKILGKIIRGEISEEKIYSIENVIRKQNEQLENMFYGEEALGLEGINSKEKMKKIIEIIDIMSKEIDEIIKK